MSNESLATSQGLTGTLKDVYDAFLGPNATTPIAGVIDFADDPKFDVLMGWPIQGALHNFIELSNPATAINSGMWVQYSSGKLIKADSPATASPIQMMVALDNNTSTTVIAANYRMPVLTSNFRFRTDQFVGAPSTSGYTIGMSVTAVGGLTSTANPTTTQIVGTVVGVDAVRGTIDVEVN